MKHKSISSMNTDPNLLKKCSALQVRVNILERELAYYRKKNYVHSEQRLKQLEDELESQRAANEQLTNELMKR